MSIKLRPPPDCGAVSHKNEVIKLDADGYADVEEDVAHVLSVHGFIPVTDGADEGDPVSRKHLLALPAIEKTVQADDFSGYDRPDLFSFLKAHGVSVSLPITDEALRALARKTLKSNSRSIDGCRK